MAKICPRCGGNEVGCPVCNAPPKRVLPKSSKLYNFIYNAVYGAKVWEVQGIDISKWNGTMNFAITKTKCQYAFLRYGYGDGWKDPKVDEYYAQAKANDFPVGAYWYNYIGKNAIAHADGFADVLQEHPPTMKEIVGDFETTTLGKDESLNWIKAFDNRLKTRTGMNQTPYTSPYFWMERIARSSYWINRLPWQAQWTVSDNPMPIPDFTGWLHWQWSADGNLKASQYGSTGGDPDMDLDRFNGTVAQFNAKYGTHILPIGTPQPPPPGTLPEYVLPTTNLSIHSEPSPMLNNIVGTANFNTKWYPYELVTANGREWWRVGLHLYIDKYYTRTL